MDLNEIFGTDGGTEFILYFFVKFTDDFTERDAEQLANTLATKAIGKTAGIPGHREGVSYNIRFDHPEYYRQAVMMFRRRLRGRPKIELIDWEHYKV
ncbi:hypothetical protein LCGC14_0763480 [marine sediment metagenome]|uniref:Uncharacterized protein n=1 Tax=marine sediment metagenome TaxID=412755 RepID=A0A0F9Q0M3_9ZZZZ